MTSIAQDTVAQRTLMGKETVILSILVTFLVLVREYPTKAFKEGQFILTHSSGHHAPSFREFMAV